jgi:hypothetical protein
MSSRSAGFERIFHPENKQAIAFLPRLSKTRDREGKIRVID